MKFLNLGCGYKYVKADEWLNADMMSIGDDVVKCNFLDGIPFETGRFDLVYHSHVLEHFAKADGEKFIAECYRILKPGGVIRIALPNLEVIAKEYLKNLDRAAAGEQNADHDYDWTMLEMYDQTVRNKAGGNMMGYLTQDRIPNERYVFGRIGAGGEKWRKEYSTLADTGKGRETVLKKIIERPSLIFKGIKQLFIRLVLSKKNLQYYKAGQFRFGGEIHQWMYDRYSLGRLLQQVGFKEIVVRTATASYVENWSMYKLDDPTETASLFIEATR
ncbi:MAG: methyltransferase domain-containing protein [Chitinophagaceae bacterium]